MTDRIDVTLELLDKFAQDLDDRLADLEARDVPGVHNPIPVGGAPAWEGQALSDAYWYSAEEAKALLSGVRKALSIARRNSADTADVYRTRDGNSAANNARIARAISSGRAIGGLQE